LQKRLSGRQSQAPYHRQISANRLTFADICCEGVGW
jgi:hypothetical protein